MPRKLLKRSKTVFPVKKRMKTGTKTTTPMTMPKKTGRSSFSKFFNKLKNLPAREVDKFIAKDKNIQKLKREEIQELKKRAKSYMGRPSNRIR